MMGAATNTAGRATFKVQTHLLGKLVGGLHGDLHVPAPLCVLRGAVRRIFDKGRYTQGPRVVEKVGV